MNSVPSHPNFSGTWELDRENSVMRGPLPARLIVEIEHAEPKLRQEVVVVDASGRESRQVITLEIGGETEYAINGVAARSRAAWHESELRIETWMKAPHGEMWFKDHWSISADGKVLTMAHRDDALAGQTAVLQRKR